MSETKSYPQAISVVFLDGRSRTVKRNVHPKNVADVIAQLEATGDYLKVEAYPDGCG